MSKNLGTMTVIMGIILYVKGADDPNLPGGFRKTTGSRRPQQTVTNDNVEYSSGPYQLSNNYGMASGLGSGQPPYREQSGRDQPPLNEADTIETERQRLDAEYRREMKSAWQRMSPNDMYPIKSSDSQDINSVGRQIIRTDLKDGGMASAWERMSRHDMVPYPRPASIPRGTFALDQPPTGNSSTSSRSGPPPVRHPPSGITRPFSAMGGHTVRSAALLNGLSSDLSGRLANANEPPKRRRMSQVDPNRSAGQIDPSYVSSLVGSPPPEVERAPSRTSKDSAPVNKKIWCKGCQAWVKEGAIIEHAQRSAICYAEHLHRNNKIN